MKRLSFIVPMFNAEPFIERCVRSIENQNLPNNEYEILLIDDKSTDKTIDIVERLKESNSSIYIIKSEKKLGAGGARNLGIDYAQGRYLWFIDADDYIFKNVAMTLLRIAEDNCLNLLFFDIEIVKQGKSENITSTFAAHLHLKNLDRGINIFHETSFRIEPVSYLVENSYIKKIGLKFDENRYAEDIKFSHHLIMYADRVGKYDSKPYVYVHRPGSVERNQNPAHISKTVTDKIYAIIGLKSMLERFNKTEVHSLTSRKIHEYIDTHAFFALLRLRKSDFSFSDMCKIYTEIKKSKLLPLKFFPNLGYPGVRWKVLKCIVNTSWIFLPGSFLLSIFYKLRKLG